jgi:ribose 5-phosphate isomerase A
LRREGVSTHPGVVHAELEKEKQLAAQAAVELVEDGMTVGLGTGTTAAYLFPALAARRLSVRCVASSVQTETAAVKVGLRVEPFTMNRLDIAIDGADQIDPLGWLVKGGGAAHTREKLVAAAADRFIVIADSSKPVSVLRPPIPLELLLFGLEATMARLETTQRRHVPLSPDGGVIFDFTGDFSDPTTLAAWFDAIPGVVGHGLFPPAMVSTILIGRGASVDRRDLSRP